MTMVMADREVTASTFKATCLALLDEVAESGNTLVVTKRGKPVANVVPASELPSLAGSVRFNVSDEELIEPLGESWQAAQP